MLLRFQHKNNTCEINCLLYGTVLHIVLYRTDLQFYKCIECRTLYNLRGKCHQILVSGKKNSNTRKVEIAQGNSPVGLVKIQKYCKEAKASMTKPVKGVFR